eukprot:6186872-Pleurochrysis_carterae.AAC.4
MPLPSITAGADSSMRPDPSLEQRDLAAADMHVDEPEPARALTNPPSADAGESEACALSNVGGQAERPPLVCIGLDDQAMCRLLHELIFETFLDADPERSGSIGETREEIEAFVEVVMGKLDLSLRHVPLEQQRAADVVIIDQNLVMGSGCSVFGSDIAKRLRREGFRGVIGLLTGSADIEVRRLAALEEVDFAFAKYECAAAIAERITSRLQHG